MSLWLGVSFDFRFLLLRCSSICSCTTSRFCNWCDSCRGLSGQSGWCSRYQKGPVLVCYIVLSCHSEIYFDLFNFSALRARNLAISISTALSTRFLSSGRYPTINKSSSQTKRGARKTAWKMLSRRAGALPSNLPWPTNCRSQQTMCRAVDVWFVLVGACSRR